MRNIYVLPVLFLFLFSACATAYRNKTMPDELYGSAVETKDANEDIGYSSTGVGYQYANNQREDRYLRMKTENPGSWGSLDDYGYWNDSRYYYDNYAYGPSVGFCSQMGYGPIGYNSFYNPYYTGGIYCYQPSLYGMSGYYYPISGVILSKTPYNGFSASTSANNLNAYKNKSYNNTNNNTYTSPTNGPTQRDVRPVRYFYNTPSSNVGGRSGGFRSTGSSSYGGRSGKH